MKKGDTPNFWIFLLKKKRNATSLNKQRGGMNIKLLKLKYIDKVYIETVKLK